MLVAGRFGAPRKLDGTAQHIEVPRSALGGIWFRVYTLPW